VIKAIEELKRAGMTILLAEQSLRFAERVADRVYKVEKGRLA
jgi:ABC-type branched-subunit amino acid transport system ATPase component